MEATLQRSLQSRDLIEETRAVFVISSRVGELFDA